MQTNCKSISASFLIKLAMQTLTYKKDGLSTVLYSLPRLQEIVVLVASANIMAPHDVPKQNQNIPVA